MLAQLTLSPLAVAPPPTIAHRRAAILPALRQATVTCPTPGCGCTVRADRVDRHLLRCPALATQRELSALGFYRPGLHAAAATTATLQTLSPDDAGLWRRLHVAHAAATPALFHTPSTTSLDIDGANERERHRQHVQRRSIASILADLGVLGRASCVVEVGAGNGELSLELARSVSGAASSDKFVLLDQASKPRGRTITPQMSVSPSRPGAVNRSGMVQPVARRPVASPRASSAMRAPLRSRLRMAACRVSSCWSSCTIGSAPRACSPSPPPSQAGPSASWWVSTSTTTR